MRVNTPFEQSSTQFSVRVSPAVRHWFNFVLAMTEKEIKARYKHAFLGFLWIILNPLLQMLVIGFVFRFFVPVQVDNYFLFLFTGLLPWMFFSLSLTKATPSIVHERSLIQKAKFPREVIPLSIVLSNLFHLVISLGLLVLVLLADKIFVERYSLVAVLRYTANMVWLAPLVAWLTIVAAGVSLLTSALNVRYRDVNFIVQAFVPLWFYATPVVYTLQLLPEKLLPILYLNPVTWCIEAIHGVLLKGLPPADIQLWPLGMLVGLALSWTGVVVFFSQKKWFDDWV